LSADALTTQAVSTCHTELARSRPSFGLPAQLLLSNVAWFGSALPYLEIAVDDAEIFAIALDHSFELLANRIVVRLCY